MSSEREESKAQGGTSRQETEEHGMQTYCCDAAVGKREGISLFKQPVLLALYEEALVDKVSRVKCHKPTQEIVWERVRGGIV